MLINISIQLMRLAPIVKMKFWLTKYQNKLVVQAVLPNGKRINKQSFELNQRRVAKTYIESLKQQDPSHIIPQSITFEEAFKKYYTYLNNNTLNQDDTNERYISLLMAHIQPYIDEIHLSEYTASIFKETTIPRIIKSRKTLWKKIDGVFVRTPLGKTIGKKTIKDVVATFKRFIIFCDDKEWKIDLKILRYKFSKNFKQEQPEPKWIPKMNDVYNLIHSEKNICYKTLWRTAAELGPRLNEILAICYDDVFWDDELNEYVIWLRHSLGQQSEFRPHYLKNEASNRKVEIGSDLFRLIQAWKDIQKFPKTHQHQYKRLFPYTKSHAADILKRTVIKRGIEWKKAFSPFRKFSSTLLKDKELLTEDEFLTRYGWSNDKTFKKHYRVKHKNLDGKRKAAHLNNLITMKGN